MRDIVELDYYDNEVIELLSHCLGDPQIETIDSIVQSYFASDSKVIYVNKREMNLIGLIGIEIIDSKIIIKHISVNPKYRRIGIGEGLVNYIKCKHGVSIIEAETDDDAVNFYRRIGFDIHNLGEKYIGITRYLCSWIRNSSS